MKTYNLPKEITIELTKWNAKNNPHNIKAINDCNSYLLSKRGMCCLGFACHQAGVALRRIKYNPMPTDIEGVFIKKLCKKIPSLCLDEYIPTDLARDAAGINDDPLYTIHEKIEKLKKLFAKEGITLKFTLNGELWNS